MTTDALAILARSDDPARFLPRDARAESLWLARARAGDEAAFHYLLDTHQARAVRLAAHVLGAGGDAEDAAAEAFARAFRAVKSVRGEAFAPFLCRIVVRVCSERQRKAGWKRELSLAEWDAPHAPPPADTRLVVQDLLDKLSPPLRAALVLRELDGMDYDDIARVLGVPVGTVRSRLSAARAAFRQMWAAVQKETDNA